MQVQTLATSATCVLVTQTLQIISKSRSQVMNHIIDERTRSCYIWFKLTRPWHGGDGAGKPLEAIPWWRCLPADIHLRSCRASISGWSPAAKSKTCATLLHLTYPQRTIRCCQVQICLTWSVYGRVIIHLKSFQRVAAILLLTQPHNALFTILLDLATQGQLELRAVAEIAILAGINDGINEILVYGFVITRLKFIVQTNAQENPRQVFVVFPDILDKGDFILVDVAKSVVEQPPQWLHNNLQWWAACFRP